LILAAKSVVVFKVSIYAEDAKIGLDILYKNLYKLRVEKEDPKPRVRFEGDSLEVIREWPKDAKINVGGDLRRLENHEDPLDHKFVGDGLHELRDRQKNVWFRLLYWLNSGWIYVLHCFTKKTNKISQSDIDLAKDRKKAILKRKDPPYEPPVEGGGEEKSA
jgi:phage-related protein